MFGSGLEDSVTAVYKNERMVAVALTEKQRTPMIVAVLIEQDGGPQALASLHRRQQALADDLNHNLPVLAGAARRPARRRNDGRDRCLQALDPVPL